MLCIGFLIMGSGFALRNSFSVFYPAVVADFGWTRGNTAIMFSLSIFIYGVLSPVVGGLIDRFKPQLLISLGIVLIGSSIALCGLATQEWHFYLLYGVVAAVGVSMFGITPLAAVITPWFSRHRALVFAVLAAGFGVSLVAASAIQLLISSYGWRQALAISGVTVVAVIVPLTLVFLRRAPVQEEALPRAVPHAAIDDGVVQPSEDVLDTDSSQGWHARDWTLRRALKTPQFWMLWVAGFCQLGLAEKAAIAHEVYFFQDAGYSPMEAASVYSVFGLVFVVGNLVSSLSDKIGREKVYLPACGLAILGTLCLFLISDASQPWMAYLFAVVFGF
ncbi:MAG: MFS transporter [Dehalococcoidia bacterium]|nr:MFS transporter [Dehalococcoidia bacterium]